MTWLDNAERDALAYAGLQFERWQVEQPDLSELRKGVRGALAGLATVEDFTSVNAARLLALLQAQPPHKTKSELFAEIAQTRALLVRIDSATTPKGGPRDADAEMFVCFAADAWVDFTGKLPSSSSGSRFLQALERTAPVKVTRELLRDVLPRWREFRRG